MADSCGQQNNCTKEALIAPSAARTYIQTHTANSHNQSPAAISRAAWPEFN